MGRRPKAKEIWVTLLILICQMPINAQLTEKKTGMDTTRYKIITDISKFPELRIKIDEEWKTFELIEEITERFDYECERVQLNGKDTKELVIRWSNAMYGTGGGSTTKGIQIWNLDSGIRLLNEITACAEENFGRHESSSYFMECQKEIRIEGQSIIIQQKNCKTEWSNTKTHNDPTLNCKLTTLEEGEYTFVKNELKKK